MNAYSRRAAATVAAAALAVSLSSSAFGSPQERELGRDKGGVVRILKKIQKILGITTHEDLPTPPHPNGPK